MNTETIEPEVLAAETALELPFQSPTIVRVLTGSETYPALHTDIVATLKQVRELPAYAPLKQEMRTALVKAGGLTVTDQMTYDQADALVPVLGELADRGKAWWEPVTSFAFRVHRWLTARRAADVDPLEKERKRIADEAWVWHAAEERRVQQLAAETARAEKQRQDAEAAEQAALLEQQGHPELAAAIVAQAIATPAPAVVLPVAKAKNLSHDPDWDITIVNAALLPREYLMPNEPAILKVVRALKGNIRIPGVQITETRATRGRRRSA